MAPRTMLKIEDEALGFKILPQAMASVNVCLTPLVYETCASSRDSDDTAR